MKQANIDSLQYCSNDNETKIPQKLITLGPKGIKGIVELAHNLSARKSAGLFFLFSFNEIQSAYHQHSLQ